MIIKLKNFTIQRDGETNPLEITGELRLLSNGGVEFPAMFPNDMCGSPDCMGACPC